MLVGIRVVLVGLFTVFLGGFLLSRDPVYCLVDSNYASLTPGYFAAKDGIYIRRGCQIEYLPEFLEVLALKRTTGKLYTIRQSTGHWSLYDYSQQAQIAFSTPDRPVAHLFHPPPGDWKRGNVSDSSTWQDVDMSVTKCTGELPDAPMTMFPTSNMEILMSRPATTLLLTLIIGVAVYLSWNSVPVEPVSFSYHAMIQQGEYWRCFTASFAHYDILHLVFNLSSLYELGALESVYGSLAFLFLNIMLVIFTMALCCGQTFLLIKWTGNDSWAHQQSIGFSCVLFSWMVVAAALMQRYCPIFFLPDLCFNTTFVPIPLTPYTIPVNLAPFALLIVTKLIIPRSSFLGHLAGILIGYPLAWGMLTWVTPSMLGIICCAAIMIIDDLLVWKYPGFRSPANLSDFVPIESLKTFNRLWIAWLVSALLTLASPWVFGPLAALPRFAVLGLTYLAMEARRCEWLTDLIAWQDRCVRAMTLSLTMILLTLISDTLTLATWIASSDFLSQSCPRLQPFIYYIIYLASMIMVELAQAWLLVISLQTCPRAVPWLRTLRLDASSIANDLRVVAPATRAFSGRAQVLQTSTAERPPSRREVSRPIAVI